MRGAACLMLAALPSALPGGARAATATLAIDAPALAVSPPLRGVPMADGVGITQPGIVMAPRWLLQSFRDIGRVEHHRHDDRRSRIGIADPMVPGCRWAAARPG